MLLACCFALREPPSSADLQKIDKHISDMGDSTPLFGMLRPILAQAGLLDRIRNEETDVIMLAQPEAKPEDELVDLL